MQAHPNPNDEALGPTMGCERPLRVCSRGNAVRRSPGAEEERVALRVHFLAAVRGCRSAEQPIMLCPDLRIPVAEFAEQPRRAFDVREQEGDGAAQTLSHGSAESVSRRTCSCQPAG
jgi:hypothetical protein